VALHYFLTFSISAASTSFVSANEVLHHRHEPAVTALLGTERQHPRLWKM
jgi:hypothetical protein